MASDDGPEDRRLERVFALRFAEKLDDLAGVGRPAVCKSDPFERARVDCLRCQVLDGTRPACAAWSRPRPTPSRTSSTGLMERREPTRCDAPPMRPPLRKKSRLSTTPNTWARPLRVFDVGNHLVERLACRHQVHRVQDEQSEAHRQGERVDHLDPDPVGDCVSSGSRCLISGGDLRREVHADHPVHSGVCCLGEDSLKGAG